MFPARTVSLEELMPYQLAALIYGLFAVLAVMTLSVARRKTSTGKVVLGATTLVLSLSAIGTCALAMHLSIEDGAPLLAFLSASLVIFGIALAWAMPKEWRLMD